MTDEQIKYMTERFLTWKLPMLFAPDGGITFEHFRNVGTPYEARNEPTGTNLLHAGQAEAMIRHLVAGLPEAAPSSPGDGWVMVPIVPRDEMVRAGDAVLAQSTWPDADDIWTAMIDARPLPTEGEGTNG